MALKYTKAPISELICGIFFNSGILVSNGIIFELLSDLVKTYPIINTHPITPEETVNNGLLQATIDYSKSGFVTYNLSTVDRKFNILLRNNSLTFHWSRKDSEEVGHYPGFQTIFNLFNENISKIVNLFSKYEIDFDENIRSYYLAYVDRVNFEEFKKGGKSIADIINLTPPNFTVSEKNYNADNFVNRYSTDIPEINGYSIIGINTPTITIPPIGQILIVDNHLKGFYKKEAGGISKWFEIAHQAQLSFFENIFSNEILKSWE